MCYLVNMCLSNRYFWTIKTEVCCYIVNSNLQASDTDLGSGGARQRLGAKRPKISRSPLPWNILVKNQEVNCAEFSNFDRFCSQDLQTTSANCFAPRPLLPPLYTGGLFGLLFHRPTGNWAVGFFSLSKLKVRNGNQSTFYNTRWIIELPWHLL